ncbi:hypothetical protein [Lacrimispora sphenoides]|jgi:hypothetical protein|uniref:hypothetical protein n=1 Tax=Lacrimispora sphenoides TaxID=29370 RepID=UPI000B80B671|nr:hypothetical protein [Lacrimispora sphenoides]
MDKTVLVEIDRTIKEIWKVDVKSDYDKYRLLREDSLKCALYYHMRRKLDSILKENNLRIYPEYYINMGGLKYRPDIVIVKVGSEEKRFLKDMITEIVAIIELKYEYGNSQGTANVIKRDIQKMKEYRQKMKLDCQCYFAVIYEEERDYLNWTDKRTSNRWGRGCLTEMNAGYINGEMTFEVNSYNNL